VVEADAERQKAILNATGEASAIFQKMEAQAKGINEILSKTADGFEKIVKAAGGDASRAATLMIVDKLPQLVEMQTNAIKNIKFDKIVVWDSGKGTANFASSLMGALPPLQEVFKMAGVSLPPALMKDTAATEAAATPDKPVPKK
jgi:flotillin